MSKAASTASSITPAKNEMDALESAAGSDGNKQGGILPTDRPVLTPEQERRLWRKVDIRIVPILTIMYLFSFMDRGNIGNAKLQRLVTQLDLTGSKYNLLKKFRPSRWLPGLTILWGIILTLMGLVKTYPQLVGTRIILGAAEAGLFPGVVYYMTLWYPRHMLQFRVGLFYGGASAAGAFSGVLAYGISFMSGTSGLLGWSWIFIIEGIVTAVIGLIACFVIVDFPDTARFLTHEERAYLIWKKKYDNSTVGEEEHFEMRHLKAVLCDWQIYMQIIVFMSVVSPLLGISLFLPSIINGFGYGTAVSQLLTVPPYICATILLVIFAVWSDYSKLRSPFILAGLGMALIGFAINISDAPIGVKYFGTFFCVSGSYAAFPGVIAWLGNNLAGQYKRAAGMAVQIGIGNLASIVVSNIYLSKDAPRYILGHALELMFIGIGFVFVPLTVMAYKLENTRRDKQEREIEGKGIKYTVEEIKRMGDRAPDFRYTL